MRIKRAIKKRQLCKREEEGGRVLLGIFGGGVPPGSSNPDPILDQNMPFSIRVYSFIRTRDSLENRHTRRMIKTYIFRPKRLKKHAL